MDKLLSLCMIVKNEEDVIARCLDSVKMLVDEIVIVDTGSTDRTVEIASAYTDLIHPFTWIDDFAAAKNEALRHATGKWILVLDADEYVEEADIGGLTTFLRNQPANSRLAYNVRIMNFTGSSMKESRIIESNADRIFPNYAGIRYDRPIHEQLVAEDGETVYNRKCPLRIYHTGYLQDRLDSKQKSKRNLALFEKLKSERAMVAYDYFTLGNEYKAQRENTKAAESYLKALESAIPNAPWYLYCVTGAISVLFLLERMKEAEELLRSSALQWQDYPEYASMEAFLYQYFGKYDTAVERFKDAVHCGETLARLDKDSWIISPDYATKIPYGQLISVFQRSFNKDQTIYYLIKSLNYDPNQLDLVLKLCEFLIQTEDPQWIRSFFEQNFGSAHSRMVPVFFHCFLNLGHLELASFYEEKLREPLSLYDRLRLMLLSSDNQGFSQAWAADDSVKLDEKLVRTIIVASVTWNDASMLDKLFLQEENSTTAAATVAQNLIKGQPVTPDEIARASKPLFLVLTELFYMKQFDAFERLVGQLQSDAIINQLTSFFFSKHYLQLAIHFASLQIQQNRLDADGYEHLGMFYLAEGEIEEGLAFLKTALLLKPEKLHLYALYHDRINNAEERFWVRQQFAQHHPQHVGLTFLFKN